MVAAAVFEFLINAKADRLRRKLTEIALKIEGPLRPVNKQHSCFLLQVKLSVLQHGATSATRHQHNSQVRNKKSAVEKYKLQTYRPYHIF
jgi:hypothetical protein